ncbi:MAG: heme-binding protein [Gemmatimonadaceae bacterium]
MSQPSTEPELRKTGEPTYRLELHTDAYDIRVYQPYLVAEVIVPGPAESASSEGFRLLAAYIFGANNGSHHLEMTAPVTQTPVTPPMTVPVTQSRADGGFRVRFAMPAGYTVATLPVPHDPHVKLCEVPAQRVAVLRYSGRWTEENYAEHLAELRASLTAAGLTVRGAPILARYDAPYVLPFLRRNEVWLSLD